MSGDDEEEQKKKKKGPLDWLPDFLNPTTWFSGFGGIFKMLLFAVGAYFVMASETVQDWVRNKISPEAADWMKNITDQVKGLIGGAVGGDDKSIAEKFNNATHADVTNAIAKTVMIEKVGEPVYRAVTKKPEIWLAFRNTVKEANGGKITDLTQISNDKSIFALATKQPQLAKEIVTAVMNDPKSKMAGDMTSTIKALLTEERIKVLLSKANRTNTLEIMAAILPADKNGAKPTAANLEKEMHLVIDRNGELIEKHVPILLKTLQEKFNNAFPGNVTPSSGATPPGTTTASMTSADNTISADSLKEGAVIQFGEANRKHIENLDKWLRQKDSSLYQMLAPLAAGDNTQIDQSKLALVALHPKNVDAVIKFSKAVNPYQIPDDPDTPGESKLRNFVLSARDMSPNMQKVISECAAKDVDIITELKKLFTTTGNANPLEIASPGLLAIKMMDPHMQELINKVGAVNISTVLSEIAPDYAKLLTPHNLNLLANVTKDLANNKHNREHPDSKLIISSFIEFATGNVDSFLSLCDMVYKAKDANDKTDPLKKAEFFTDFFKDPDNQATLGKLINGIRVPNNPILKIVRDNYKKADGSGVVSFMSSPEAMTRLPNIIRNPQDEISYWETTVFGSGPVSDNYSWLKQIGEALNSAAKVPPVHMVATNTRNNAPVTR